MTKLSIITSIFKGGIFVEPFLNNIAEQSIYSECTHFLFCCNPEYGRDEELCENWAKDHPNVVFEHLCPDPGLYEVWNIACKRASTKYLTNANVDDRLLSGCLEEHVTALEENEEFDLAYCKNLCSLRVEDLEDGGKEGVQYPTGPFDIKKMLRHNLPHNHPVWRSSLHDRFGYFDTNLKSAADWEFWLRCICGGSKFLYIPKCLGVYYFNPNGVSTRKDTRMEKAMEENNVRKKHFGRIYELLRQNR